jgi:hypothetical protein
VAIYYVDGSVGNDGNTGANPGAGGTGAWATIQHGMATIIAGDSLWVKNSVTYNELITIANAGTSISPIRVAGYASVTGDKGQIIIDAQGTRSHCINSTVGGTQVFYTFENIVMASSTLANVDTNRFATFWKNCQFIHSTTDGFKGGQAFFENCKFDSNGGHGLNWQSGNNVVCVGCRFFDNGTDGFHQTISSTTLACGLIYCEFFSNNTNGISVGNSNDVVSIIINCTVDGDNKDTVKGLVFGAGFRQFACVLNSIFYDCATGIGSPNQLNAAISRNNLVNSNTTPYSGFSTFDGEVTSAPSFNNEGSNDYRPSSSSPLKNAGYDANTLEGF